MSLPSNGKAQESSVVYRNLGLSFNKKMNLEESEVLLNSRFQKLIRTTAPASYICFPFIGEFHFKKYSFIEEGNGPFKYKYFLGTAELMPSLYLFNSNKNRGNIRLTFGTKIRVWSKRRPPLRNHYEWKPSNAVKTPSYLPGVYYSRLIKSVKREGKDIMHTMEFGFTHHSNGQDAPTLAAGDSTLTLGPDYTYNIHDGDFSTNFINISWNKSIIQGNEHSIHTLSLIFDGIGTHRVEHEDLIKYKTSYKLRHIIKNEDLDPDINLGNHFIDFEISFGLVDFNQFRFSQSISASVHYHYLLPISRKLYVFANYGYMGQDNYNIFLEESLHYFKWGLSTQIQ